MYRLNRSKLQICTEILSNLASNGPKNLTNLSARVNLKEIHLKQHLELLRNSSLIAKQNFGKNKTFFAITENGLVVLQMFRPLTTEAQEIQANAFEKIISL